MRILGINQNRFQSAEIKEMVQHIDSTVYFAYTSSEAMMYLAKEKIDLVFMNISAITDLGFVKYVNDHYQHIAVYICLEEPLAEALTIAKTGRYKLISPPVAIQEIRENLLLVK